MPPVQNNSLRFIVHHGSYWREANGSIFYLVPQVTVGKDLAIQSGTTGTDIYPYELVAIKQSSGSPYNYVKAPLCL